MSWDVFDKIKLTKSFSWKQNQWQINLYIISFFGGGRGELPHRSSTVDVSSSMKCSFECPVIEIFSRFSHINCWECYIITSSPGHGASSLSNKSNMQRQCCNDVFLNVKRVSQSGGRCLLTWPVNSSPSLVDPIKQVNSEHPQVQDEENRPLSLISHLWHLKSFDSY